MPNFVSSFSLFLLVRCFLNWYSFFHLQNGMKMVVNAFPDFVLYGDIYSTSSRLIFSCNSVKLEGSTANGSGGTFKFEWPIDNIVKIESCWFGKVSYIYILCPFSLSLWNGWRGRKWLWEECNLGVRTILPCLES